MNTGKTIVPMTDNDIKSLINGDIELFCLMNKSSCDETVNSFIFHVHPEVDTCFFVRYFNGQKFNVGIIIDENFGIYNPYVSMEISVGRNLWRALSKQGFRKCTINQALCI